MYAVNGELREVCSAQAAKSAADILDRIQKALGLSSDGEICRALGIRRSTVGGWRSQDRRPYALCVDLHERLGLSLDWLLTGEGSMQREPPAAEARALSEAGAVETAARPDYAAKIAEVERHWQMAVQACAPDADFSRLLNFLEWLLDWWETAGPEDRAWLDGQLRRHIKDYADWNQPDSSR